MNKPKRFSQEWWEGVRDLANYKAGYYACLAETPGYHRREIDRMVKIASYAEERIADR